MSDQSTRRGTDILLYSRIYKCISPLNFEAGDYDWVELHSLFHVRQCSNKY